MGLISCLTNDGSLVVLGLNSLVVGATVAVAHSVLVLIGLWGKLLNRLAVGRNNWWRGSIASDWGIVWAWESGGGTDEGKENEAL